MPWYFLKSQFPNYPLIWRMPQPHKSTTPTEGGNGQLQSLRKDIMYLRVRKIEDGQTKNENKKLADIHSANLKGKTEVGKGGNESDDNSH